MVVERLKNAVSDSSSVASSDGPARLLLACKDSQISQSTISTPQDTVISSPSMERSPTIQCDTISTPAKQSKRPWPLLSSPASSPIPQGKLKKQDVKRLHPSPVTEWPQRSPIKTEHDQDVSSFALLAQCFDTLSEAEHYLKPTPEKAKDQPPRKICVGREEIDDISPIKLEGTKVGVGRNIGHQNAPLSGISGGARHPCASAEPVSFAPQPYPSHHEYHHRHNTPDENSPQEPPTYNEKGYSTTASNPFFVLRSVSKAFDSFAYRLSCLNEGPICVVNIGVHSSAFRRYPDATSTGIDFRDLKKACARVETALCVFGGVTSPGQYSPHSGIFRNRTSYANEPYEDIYHKRYTVKSDHVEWELETDALMHKSVEHRDWRSDGPRRPTTTFRRDDRDAPPSPGMSACSASVVPVDSHQKMRYRCKRCHQLKQNHACPYRNFLHRSIGVTVHASVNAFQAAEPGRLAPSLSEMNSCITMEEFPREGSSPPDPMRWMTTPRISPDATQTRLIHCSPESSLSTDSGHHNHLLVAQRIQSRPPATATTMEMKDKPLFVEAVELKPEQFRLVTSSKNTSGSNAFAYPSVPLPFEQRKRLSDTLFALAHQVPRLSEECAKLLRSARGNNEWDLGVAQLLCQLVVGLYCAEGDHCLDGLKQYLLRMGIAC